MEIAQGLFQELQKSYTQNLDELGVATNLLSPYTPNLEATLPGKECDAQTKVGC